MYPNTENWAPLWRSVHRGGCILAVCATVLFLAFQVDWVGGAFYRPHQLLKLSTGDSQWTAITTAYYDGVWVRGGSRTWNLRIMKSQAEKLRTKCGAITRKQSITALRIPHRLDAPELSAIIRELESQEPQGCVLGSERAKDGKAGSDASLFGEIIQIEEWVD